MWKLFKLYKIACLWKSQRQPSLHYSFAVRNEVFYRYYDNKQKGLKAMNQLREMLRKNINFTSKCVQCHKCVQWDINGGTRCTYFENTWFFKWRQCGNTGWFTHPLFLGSRGSCINASPLFSMFPLIAVSREHAVTRLTRTYRERVSYYNEPMDDFYIRSWFSYPRCGLEPTVYSLRHNSDVLPMRHMLRSTKAILYTFLNDTYCKRRIECI